MIVVTLMSLANVYGLFIIVFLMGYGLVEFPKFLWTYGDNEDRAKQMQTRIALVRSSCKRQVLKLMEAADEKFRR